MLLAGGPQTEKSLRAPIASVTPLLVLDLPKVYFVNKKIGKGNIRKGKSSFTVLGRLITDDEIDLGQV